MAGCTEGYGGEVFLNTRSIGSRYESAACGYLIDKGYKILERNYKNKLDFAMKHYDDKKVCRFDVIGIYGNGRIEHIENAFYLSR